MAFKDYVKDMSVRQFTTATQIKQCWTHLANYWSVGKAIPFTERLNEYNGKDVYFCVKCENGIYIVSLDREDKIVKIVRF